MRERDGGVKEAACRMEQLQDKRLCDWQLASCIKRMRVGKRIETLEQTYAKGEKGVCVSGGVGR